MGDWCIILHSVFLLQAHINIPVFKIKLMVLIIPTEIFNYANLLPIHCSHTGPDVLYKFALN